MKVDRQILMRASMLAILLAGTWMGGCGANEPDVPDDDDGGNGGKNTGGTGFPTGGNLNTGGTGFPTGGAVNTGGAVSTGGAFPTGGNTTGGAFPTGGAGPTGGSGGATGECGTTTAAAADTAIDNLEDGDNKISAPRVGYWYTYNDGMCSPAQMPAPDPSGATPFVPGTGGNGMWAAHTSGGACATWGAGMGFDLANCASASGAYNAGVFSGISFYYKSTTAIRVIIATTDVIPSTRPPGTCVPGTGMGMECDNGHGMDLAAAPAGMTVSVPFTMLSQAFGQMKPFDKTKIVNIQWQVANALAFDFTIDDVVFTP